MRQYIVDAFTERVFGGNPAAVCVLENWISDELMQKIAKENNLSETAFAVKEGECYHLRWFTPKSEIDFCGHATLGTSFVIANYIEPGCKAIKYTTLSGEMSVEVKDGVFVMDFPRYKLDPVEVTEEMANAIGVRPVAAFRDRDLLMVLESEDEVKNLKPDQAALAGLDGVCIAVTAKGTQYDCVSRVFAPELNIPEDPVTGSSHCMIAPYWAERLGKNTITAYQASERGGILYAEVCGERVKISGKAVLFGISEIIKDNGAEYGFKAKLFDELSAAEVYKILKARAAVFILEQNIRYLDMDNVDYRSLHCFFEENGKVAAYLRAYQDGEKIRIGRVLTVTRGQGHGRMIMERGIVAAREAFGYRTVIMDAQKHAEGFYRKLGFKTISGEFLEEGVVHVQMELPP